MTLSLSTTCGRKIFTEFHRERTESAEKRYWTRTDLASQEASRSRLSNQKMNPSHEHRFSARQDARLARPVPPLRRMAPTPFELVVVEPYRRLQSSQDQGDLGNTVRRCTATAHAAAPRGCRTFP